MYLAAALCLLLCGCGKKDAAEAQAVQQRYAALTGAVAEAEIVSHPEGETRSFTVRCTCDRTKDTATTASCAAAISCCIFSSFCCICCWRMALPPPEKPPRALYPFAIAEYPPY